VKLRCTHATLVSEDSTISEDWFQIDGAGRRCAPSRLSVGRNKKAGDDLAPQTV
jgi:hypothetical protein